MELISTQNAPLPGGHYSQATVHNNTVYVSGLLPIRIGEKPDASMGFEDQVELVLNYLKGILEEAGSSMDNVLKVSIFVSDIENWPKVNDIYMKSFGEHKPARIVVPVKDLHFGFGIEIDAVAAI